MRNKKIIAVSFDTDNNFIDFFIACKCGRKN